MKIQELFSDKSKWTKGYISKDKDGNCVSVHDTNAICFCLVGSVYKCYKGEFVTDVLRKIRGEIANEFKIKCSDDLSIADYNDSDLTSFEDIKRIITKLDI